LFEVETQRIPSDVHLWVPHLILPSCRPASDVFHPLPMSNLSRFLKQAILSPEELKIKPFRKTFIYRTKSAYRSLTNEKEVLKNAESLGFKIVAMEEMSFSQQVKCIHESEIVMGLHGAGLANAMFMQKGATLIECIETEFAHYAHPFPFRNLCAVMGVRYAAIGTVKNSEHPYVYTPPSKANSKIRMSLVNSSQSLDPIEIQRAIEAIEKNE